MTIRLVAAVLAVTAVTACGKQQNSNDGSPQVTPAQAEAKKGLKGRWASTCAEGQNQTLTGPSILGLTQRSQLEFAEGAMIEVTSVTTLPCEGNDIEITAVGAPAIKPTNDDERGTINVDFDTYRVKPVTPIGASMLNIANWCGIKDWTVGTERDVKEQLGKKQCFTARKLTTAFAVDDKGLSLVGKPDSSTPSDQTSNIKLRFTRL